MTNGRSPAPVEPLCGHISFDSPSLWPWMTLLIRCPAFYLLQHSCALARSTVYSALSDLPDGWNGHAHLSCQNLQLIQLSPQVIQRVAHPRGLVSIRQTAQVRRVPRLSDHSDQCP